MDASISADQEQGILRTYYRYVSSFQQCVAREKTIRMATLGPAGTSSEAAAEYVLAAFGIHQGHVALYPTYEEAMASVLAGQAQFLVVANAYERIDWFYMSPALELVLPFVYDTPPYGLAQRLGATLPKKRCVTIASHHAPQSLIPYLLDDAGREHQVINARSTSEAARKVSCGEVDLCVTNLRAAAIHGVEFISQLYTIHMLWSVFRPRPPDAVSHESHASQQSAPAQSGVRHIHVANSHWHARLRYEILDKATGHI